MSRAQSPGTFPIIKRKPRLEDYQRYFPNMDWIICQHLNCDCVIRKRNINYYIVIDKYLCGCHGIEYIQSDDSYY